MNELYEWYEEGKGKPLFWVPSAEESNAIMMKENPQYSKYINNKTYPSLKAGQSIAKASKEIRKGQKSDKKEELKKVREMNELDEWYEEMMKKTLTDTEKNRIQKEYDKRKEKGKGKPFFWLQSAEESNAVMMKENPQYAKYINNKTNQSLKAGQSIAKRAKGFANAGVIISALNGDKETAKELAKASKEIRKSEKEMKSIRKGQKSDKKEEPKKTQPKDENSYTLDEVVKLNNGDPKKVREWIDNHPRYDVGDKTKKWLEENKVDEETKMEDKNKKTTLKDLEKSSNNEQDKEAYSDAQVFENVTDALKKDKNDYDEMNKIVDKFYEKSSNIDDYYKENIPKSIWSMYKNGEFDGNTGDEKKDKKIGKERLGYLIMNHLGNGLVNASLIARGSSPTQVSDLQKIRNEKLEGALERYNKKRDETMSKTLEQLGLNAELLNKFNIDTDTLKNNKIFDEVSKSRDRKNIERTIRAYKVAGEYLDKLSDEQKKNVFMAIMAMNTNDAKSAGISYLTTTLGNNALGRIFEAFED